jgi:hypothetical protein
MPCSTPAYKLFLAVIWIGLIVHAVVFAPQQEVAGMNELIQLMLMDTKAFDAWVIALFNLMGVWPMIMAAILLVDSRGQRVPAWPFLLGSCVLGSFVLYPYLLIRGANPQFDGKRTLAVKFADSKVFAGIITLATVFMIGFGAAQGSVEAFVATFKVNNLVNIMSLDFLLFIFAFPAVLGDDMLRRGLQDRRQFWLYSIVPVLGPCAYLLGRPPLQTSQSVSKLE